MRVGLFHFYSLTYGGGGERFITELATYLSSRGYAVEVHTLPWGRGEAPIELPSDVLYCEKPVHRVRADVAYYMYTPLTPHLFFCSAPKVAGLHAPVVAEEHPSAIDSFRQGPHVFAAFLARRFAAPGQLRSRGRKYQVPRHGAASADLGSLRQSRGPSSSDAS